MPRINANNPSRYEVRAPRFETIAPLLHTSSPKPDGLKLLDAVIAAVEKTLAEWSKK